MRLLCILSLLVFQLFALSVGFNYSKNPPVEIFNLYDWVVIDPNANVDLKYIKSFNRAKIFAYVSIIENRNLNKNWKIGENKTWNNSIYDIRNPAYRQYLLNKLKKLQNYDGFMFDTLDSYKLALKKSEYKSYEKALASFIREVHRMFPNKKIILNRGFEILDMVHDSIDAVLAENLFFLNYKPQKQEDFEQLNRELQKVKSYGLIPIVIEYSKDPLNELDLARKIKEMGYVPFITNKSVTSVGLGDFLLIKRNVLLIYNPSKNENTPPDDSEAHRLFALPIQFWGYKTKTVRLKDIYNLKNINELYSGIVVVLSGNIPDKQKFITWIKQRIKEGIKVVFYQQTILDEDFANALNLNYKPSSDIDFKLTKIEKNYQFEIKPQIIDFTPDYIISPSSNITPKIVFTNKHGEKFVTTAITPWGGYCVNPLVIINNTLYLFSINNFNFLKEALRLKDLPLPDTTTLNGKRIAISHIDGDGFMEMNHQLHKFASEVLYEKLFSKTTFPFSVSVIIAEISPQGLYPQYSKKLIQIARKIYRLKNVEAASHSYTHPFTWKKANPPRLPVKNYHFSLEKEIIGSVEYINRHLLPKNKKTKLMFWTGDCEPPAKALKIAYDYGLLNINGGDTGITNEKPFFMYIMPIGIEKNGYFQVYAPITNENIYTDLWKNKAGYIKAIQTFQLTNYPYRLKPIDIYFHHYSGSTPQSLNALLNVYHWVLKQDIIPLFTSTWTKMAVGFEYSVIAKSITDNQFYILNKGNLKTLKIKGNKIIDMKKSKNVIGFRKINGFTYIFLNSKGKYRIVFGNSPNQSYLISSNGRVKNYKTLKNGYQYILSSHLPIKIEMYKTSNCKTYVRKYRYSAKIKVVCE